MRVTIDLDEHILRYVRQLALEHGATLSRIVSDLVRERLLDLEYPSIPRLPRLPGARPVTMQDVNYLRELND